MESTISILNVIHEKDSEVISYRSTSAQKTQKYQENMTEQCVLSIRVLETVMVLINERFCTRCHSQFWTKMRDM